MEVLFVIVFTCFIISFLIKGILHLYLNDKNGYESPAGYGLTYIYMLPYDNDVAPEYEKTKRLCNIMQKVFVVLAILSFMLFLVKDYGGKTPCKKRDKTLLFAI